jgi:hypothetical protein
MRQLYQPQPRRDAAAPLTLRAGRSAPAACGRCKARSPTPSPRPEDQALRPASGPRAGVRIAERVRVDAERVTERGVELVVRRASSGFPSRASQAGMSTSLHSVCTQKRGMCRFRARAPWGLSPRHGCCSATATCDSPLSRRSSRAAPRYPSDTDATRRCCWECFAPAAATTGPRRRASPACKSARVVSMSARSGIPADLRAGRAITARSQNLPTLPTRWVKAGYAHRAHVFPVWSASVIRRRMRMHAGRRCAERRSRQVLFVTQGFRAQEVWRATTRRIHRAASRPGSLVPTARSTTIVHSAGSARNPRDPPRRHGVHGDFLILLRDLCVSVVKFCARRHGSCG